MISFSCIGPDVEGSFLDLLLAGPENASGIYLRRKISCL